MQYVNLTTMCQIGLQPSYSEFLQVINRFHERFYEQDGEH